VWEWSLTTSSQHSAVSNQPRQNQPQNQQSALGSQQSAKAKTF
jgi:hypothetical protein